MSGPSSSRTSLDGHVVLADVHAVGARLARHRRPVVDDQAAPPAARTARARRARPPPAPRRAVASRAAARCPRRRRSPRAAASGSSRPRRSSAPHTDTGARRPGARAARRLGRGAGISRQSGSGRRHPAPSSINGMSRSSASTWRSSAAGSSAWPSRGARGERGHVGDGARARRARRGRRRMSPPGCSRRSPRWSSARPGGGCSSWACARRRCGRRSRPSSSSARAREVGLRRTGTLLLARDEDEARELERQLEFRASLGLRVERLRASEARELEPALAPTVRLALEAPDDHSVDPRARARGAAPGVCAARGVRRARARAGVARVALRRRGRARRRRELADGERVAARAGGARRRRRGAARLEGLPDRRARARAPGQGPDPAPARPRRPGPADARACASRAATWCRAADGRYVLGATVEERGFELARRPRAACMSCCATPTSWCPGVERARDRGAVASACARARPTTPR